MYRREMRLRQRHRRPSYPIDTPVRRDPRHIRTGRTLYPAPKTRLDRSPGPMPPKMISPSSRITLGPVQPRSLVSNRQLQVDSTKRRPSRLDIQRLRKRTLMRKQRGAAQVRFDKPKFISRIPQKTPRWETFATEQEKAFMAIALKMAGMETFPKLSEKGNKLVVDSLKIQRIQNPEQKEKAMVAHFNQTATELVNNSGYFAVKYRITSDPKSRQIKMTEMAGLGGFSKTRNSMQRLLRQ
jgi:hypothetical protein